ncbi:MAG: mandelate racemase/muconate lactonizing enzyme family protein [Coraliomargaritaceae bacterium]|jgi:D-galactarolactone cycloisomerase|tara:strand:- start:1455 stop:2594 length:1140 start_codon:yes stop_codon:yes gene_type:complete
MKIASIDVYPLKTDLENPIGFSQWYYSAKNNLVVKITAQDGTVGWGECYGPSHAIAQSIESYFKPLLLGKNALEIEMLWQLMWKSYLDFNRLGIFMAGISGIDIALWDLKGKLYSAPLRELLGGTSDPIPCYATGMYFRKDISDDQLVKLLLQEAEEYVKGGFSFLKIKIGKNLNFDAKLVEAFRQKFPNISLAADANHAYNYKEATCIGRLLEKNNYSWFEEPLHPSNIEDMALLRESLDVPISSGECEQTRYGFLKLSQAKALDIFQPDPAYCGGISEYLKIQAIASASHIDCIPHCWGLKINQAVSASLLSTSSENPGRFEKRAFYLEMDQTEHPIRDTIFSASHEIKDGCLHFNNLPGLGVSIDEQLLDSFKAAK